MNEIFVWSTSNNWPHVRSHSRAFGVLYWKMKFWKCAPHLRSQNAVFIGYCCLELERVLNWQYTRYDRNSVRRMASHYWFWPAECLYCYISYWSHFGSHFFSPFSTKKVFILHLPCIEKDGICGVDARKYSFQSLPIILVQNQKYKRSDSW